MSVILNQAARDALCEAYLAYQRGRGKDFLYHIQVAENAIEAIDRLGYDPARGRELEVMNLKGEKELVAAFLHIRRPRELARRYEAAAAKLVLRPSRVLRPDMAYLPPCVSAEEIIALAPSGPEEMQELSRAVSLYGQMTGGGGAGADILLRAALALKRGERALARRLIQRARWAGGAWIEAPAQKLIQAIDRI